MISHVLLPFTVAQLLDAAYGVATAIDETAIGVGPVLIIEKGSDARLPTSIDPYASDEGAMLALVLRSDCAGSHLGAVEGSPSCPYPFRPQAQRVPSVWRAIV